MRKIYHIDFETTDNETVTGYSALPPAKGEKLLATLTFSQFEKRVQKGEVPTTELLFIIKELL